MKEEESKKYEYGTLFSQEALRAENFREIYIKIDDLKSLSLKSWRR